MDGPPSSTLPLAAYANFGGIQLLEAAAQIAAAPHVDARQTGAGGTPARREGGNTSTIREAAAKRA